MQDILVRLREQPVLTDDQLKRMKQYIQHKNPTHSSAERATILANAVHRHLDKHLPEMDKSTKKQLRMQVLQSAYEKNTFMIAMHDVVQASLQLVHQSGELLAPIEQWLHQHGLGEVTLQDIMDYMAPAERLISPGQEVPQKLEAAANLTIFEPAVRIGVMDTSSTVSDAVKHEAVIPAVHEVIIPAAKEVSIRDTAAAVAPVKQVDTVNDPIASTNRLSFQEQTTFYLHRLTIWIGRARKAAFAFLLQLLTTDLFSKPIIKPLKMTKSSMHKYSTAASALFMSLLLAASFTLFANDRPYEQQAAIPFSLAQMEDRSASPHSNPLMTSELPRVSSPLIQGSMRMDTKATYLTAMAAAAEAVQALRYPPSTVTVVHPLIKESVASSVETSPAAAVPVTDKPATTSASTTAVTDGSAMTAKPAAHVTVQSTAKPNQPLAANPLAKAPAKPSHKAAKLANELPPMYKYAEIDQTIMHKWLKQRGSILAEEPYLGAIFTVARKYDIHPLLLLAIAGQEQSLVPKSNDNAKEIANNPFNVHHSWRDYNTDIADSAEIAAKTLVRLVKGRPDNKDAIVWINRKYATDTSWNVGVKRYFQLMQKAVQTS